MSNFASNGKFERESRVSHTFIINDDEVKNYLDHCSIPVQAEHVTLNQSLIFDVANSDHKSIEYFITVDGESTTVQVSTGFPSSLLTFFQFGSLVIEGADMDDVEKKPFVAAEDMKKMKEVRREKFVMPTKNIALKNGTDFRTVVRTAIQDFFRKEHAGDESMLATVYWLLFENYNPESDNHVHILSKCPHCGTEKIELRKELIKIPAYSWNCTEPRCNKEIYITDVFRLFEMVDEETGAEGIVNYLKNVIETFLIVHAIKKLLDIEEGLVSRFLIVKDGPLSFGNVTSLMHKPVQTLINFLNKTNNINLVGVESSGPFVEHAKQISGKLKPGQALLLSNKHIYTYILVGDSQNQQYGEKGYYSGKMIYKSRDERVYVLTMPVENHITYYNQPELSDFKNVQEVLFSVAKLRCDIYENALIPVAVINKMISLSTASGAKILEKFAKKAVNK